jgi:hypothetical protein
MNAFGKFKRIILFLLVLNTGIVKSQTSDEILVLYNQGNYKETITKGLLYLNTHPGDVLVSHLVGRAYTELADYNKAIPYLDIAVINFDPARSWIKGWALAYRGVCRFFGKAYAGSLQDFKDCAVLNATLNSVNFANAYRYLYFKTADTTRWVVKESDLLKCYFQKGEITANNSKFLAAHDTAYARICRYFGVTLDKKPDCFFWTDTADARLVFGSPLGFASSRKFQINSRLDQTKGHELAHVVCYQALHPILGSKLINEGVAVYLDQTVRDRLQVAKDAMAGAPLNMGDFWANNQNSNNAMYPVAGAFIEFLAGKGSKEQLFRLLTYQIRDSALSIYSNYEALEDEFESKFSTTATRPIKNPRHSVHIQCTGENLVFDNLQPGSYIDVYNLNGQKMLSFKALNCLYSEGVDHWDAGMYIVKVENGGANSTYKFIKGL